MSDPTSYAPLRDPETGACSVVLSVDGALDLAREALEQHAAANIHDHRETLLAAVCLELRLRTLIASLDNQAGREQGGVTRA